MIGEIQSPVEKGWKGQISNYRCTELSGIICANNFQMFSHDLSGE